MPSPLESPAAAPVPTTIHVVGAAILAAGRCLATQRGPRMSSPNVWEFPGGKVEPGEDAATALHREIREELALDIRVGERLGQGESVVGSRRIVLTVLTATITGGRLELREHRARRWISAAEIETLSWAAADRPILEPLRRLLGRHTGW